MRAHRLNVLLLGIRADLTFLPILLFHVVLPLCWSTSAEVRFSSAHSSVVSHCKSMGSTLPQCFSAFPSVHVSLLPKVDGVLSVVRRFALAAYGWPMYMMMNTRTGLCKIMPYLK